ncbi:MAG: T9SS type A sorting domain-containing protein [Flavobacteriaceae bacterium]|nr:T9SS type A sorting domain-containing protein [Flavobacteriaceae bacterium]
MHRRTFKTILIFLFFSFLLPSVAQGLMYEISLSEQVSASSQIIEGKVISKKSYWNASHGRIYTVNTIEVYKVFKGKTQSIVEIVTQGGSVGMDIHQVNPSLKLRIGDVGVFTLIDHSIVFGSSKKGTHASFKAYSSKQGFYKYDMPNNIVTNPFSKRKGISANFYAELKKITKNSVSEIKRFDVDKKRTTAKNNTSAKLLAATISNVSPLTGLSAGTYTVLTIEGSQFGSSQGSTGKVEFSFASDGGSSWVAAYDFQINSWSSTKIEVEIPSGAGTGTIRVTPDGGSPVESSQSITIDYAELNPVTDLVQDNPDLIQDYLAGQSQHVDDNGLGGYTWQMNSTFDANTAAKESFIRAFDAWRCETGVNWILGATTSVDVIAVDGVNIIRFDFEDELPSGTLGSFANYYSGCIIGGKLSTIVAEMDLVFDEDKNGAFGVEWEFGTADAVSPKIDFESVALHELGHGHQLNHTINLGGVMHYEISQGNNRRVLNQNDIDGGNDVQSRSLGAYLCSAAIDPMTNYVCPVVGIEDQVLENGITIFPNPASEKLFITNHTNFNLQKAIIYDVSGRVLYDIKISNSGSTKKINIEALAQGVYFLKIISDKASITKIFVVD